MTPRLFLLLIFVITLSNCTKEVVQAPQKSFFEVLNANPDSAVEITMTTALTDLLEERSSTYQEAKLDVQLSDGTYQSLHAQLKTRGQTRKKICDFPPLKLKIAEESLIQNNWDTELSSYKLVTDCIGNKDLVAKEMLAYQIFQLFSEISFKVQPLIITYVDKDNPEKQIQQFGFVIESKKALAKRLDAVAIPDHKNMIDASQYQKMTVFQYMIGNTDWNLGSNHNIKYVQLTGKKMPSPVPYDFDYAGLVDAPYAIPHPQLPIKEVKERFFQYRGKASEQLIHTLEQINTQQREILSTCHDHPLLSESAKEEVAQYLNSFFELVDFALDNKEEVVQILKDANKALSPA